jgi:hypothetical protein
LWPFQREFDSLRSPHFVRLAAGIGQISSGVLWSADCRKLFLGGRLVESRQSLKLASSVRFTPSQPLPGRSVGRTPLSESGCRWFESIPGSHFLRAHRPKERIERYERSDWGSTPHAPANRPFVQWTGYSPPKAETGVQVSEGRPQFLRGGGRAGKGATGAKLIRMSMRFLIARQRVRFPPRLPDFCEVA